MCAVKIWNSITARKRKTQPEKNSGKSMTVPNQGMTVRELMIRFASGLPVNGGRVSPYKADDGLPDLDKMDQIEIEEYYRELRSRRDEVVDRIKKRKQKAEEMKLEKIVEDRISKKQREAEEKLLKEFREKGGNSNA